MMPYSQETQSAGAPGYGTRHPALLSLLECIEPSATEELTWPGGIRLIAAAYPVPMTVPLELVTSVRCVVRVDQHVVLCQTPDAYHIWPGGRRISGESIPETVCREVHEETGWLVNEADLHLLGFLHLRHTQDQGAGHPYPHPDFLQLIYTAPAGKRDNSQGDRWRDLDGWELGHRLVTVENLNSVSLPSIQRAFLAALPH